MVRDVPGFATSRINALIGNEAFRMLEQGVASAADIDKAVKLGLNHPMGPFEMGDLVGLDVRLSILEHLHATLGETFRPSNLMRQYVQAGRLGRKTRPRRLHVRRERQEDRLRGARPNMFPIRRAGYPRRSACALASSAPLAAQLVPVGPERAVNTTTAGSQFAPGVAGEPGGPYLVVWQSSDQDGSGAGVYARLFDAARKRRSTGEIRVSQTTAGDQITPAVAWSPAGTFLVAWASNGQDGSGFGIFARRLQAPTAQPLRQRVPVNVATAGNQIGAATWRRRVTDFYVVWSGRRRQRRHQRHLRPRFRGNGSGSAAITGEVRLNAGVTGNQVQPAIAGAGSGLVAAWASDGADGSGFGVVARRFDGALAALSLGEIPVPENTIFDQIGAGGRRLRRRRLRGRLAARAAGVRLDRSARSRSSPCAASTRQRPRRASRAPGAQRGHAPSRAPGPLADGERGRHRRLAGARPRRAATSKSSPAASTARTRRLVVRVSAELDASPATRSRRRCAGPAALSSPPGRASARTAAPSGSSRGASACRCRRASPTRRRSASTTAASASAPPTRPRPARAAPDRRSRSPPDSGYFWFFNDANVEIVDQGCSMPAASPVSTTSGSSPPV